MDILKLSTLLTVSLLTFSGCNGVQPKVEEKAVVDETLPVITLTQNGIISDMTAIAFEWKSIRDPRVEEVYVYRTSPTAEDKTKISYHNKIKSRFKTHYVDTDVSPDTVYAYTFRTVAKETQGRTSEVFKVNTKPVLQSVAWIHSITGLPRSAKVIWRPHSNERVSKYRVERKTLDTQEWEEVKVINDRLNAEFLDTDLKDNSVYMYRLKVETFDGIISTPSQIVKIVTKPLPQSVTTIQTTQNLPKQIKIDWDATQQKDFEQYYLYRSDKIDGRYELIAKLYNNTFTDKINKDGKNYFYRVSVIDKDGLESEHEKLSVMGMTLPPPSAPSVVKAQLNGNKIELIWSDTDPRVKSFTVVREYTKGWFDVQRDEYTGIQQTKYIDKTIEAGTKYTYTVYALDENKIVSQASEPAVVVTPESTQRIAPPKEKEPTVIKATKPVEVQPTKQEVVAPVEDLNLNEL